MRKPLHGYTTMSVFCKAHSIKHKDFKEKLIQIGLLQDAGYRNRLEIACHSPNIHPLVMKYTGTNRSGSFQYRKDAMRWIFLGKEQSVELRERVDRMVLRDREKYEKIWEKERKQREERDKEISDRQSNTQRSNNDEESNRQARKPT